MRPWGGKNLQSFSSSCSFQQKSKSPHQKESLVFLSELDAASVAHLVGALVGVAVLRAGVAALIGLGAAAEGDTAGATETTGQAGVVVLLLLLDWGENSSIVIGTTTSVVDGVGDSVSTAAARGGDVVVEARSCLRRRGNRAKVGLSEAWHVVAGWK